MNTPEKIKLIEYLKQFATENRIKRFDEVLAKRIDHMHIVLEDIYQPHNASAVMRSADCFGVQNVHIIENRNKYKENEDIALGSGNWVTKHFYRGEENNTKNCLSSLKEKGFKIVATTPHEKDCTLKELPIDTKFALVFGTEKEGISKDVFEMADAYVKIPMYGFTESFNISVCAALCMYELTERIRSSTSIHSKLSEEEKTDVYLSWLR
ncbi:MAG: RNA methyltransferase, partial [Bacteroidia bacterium]|nr:RNA methyltransferase [Bacteroidia bacterium]